MARGVRGFIDRNLSTGDRLGEAFYAVWMVVITIGLLNSEEHITPALVGFVILAAFGVNFVWGIIDGVTVMYGNIIARAERERVVHALRAEPANEEARSAAREHLDGSVLTELPAVEKERVLDLLATSPADGNPAVRKYEASREDWEYAASVVILDTALVVPLVAPLALIPDTELAVYVSRLIATLMFATIGGIYAAHLNRSRWIAAAGVGALGYVVFTLAYMAGW
jgi:hypothetical protein